MKIIPSITSLHGIKSISAFNIFFFFLFFPIQWPLKPPPPHNHTLSSISTEFDWVQSICQPSTPFKLSASNYSTWHKRIMHLLRVNNLASYVSSENTLVLVKMPLSILNISIGVKTILLYCEVKDLSFSWKYTFTWYALYSHIHMLVRAGDRGESTCQEWY